MNRVMVVTGASRGLGAAVAMLAAKRGYDVCVNYLTGEERVNFKLNDAAPVESTDETPQEGQPTGRRSRKSA